MNYCSGCHSARYVRFNTIGKYLGLSEEELVDNLMFNAEKTFETIQSSMPASDALRWYGTAPPDMSLMARSKGADYIYNFLKGFYLDPDSPTGVDNTVLAGTSMPHVLWELQGYQKAHFSEHVETNSDGSTTTTLEFEKFELVSTGKLDVEQYESFVRDTVNFLAYIAEPIRAERRKLGTWVLIYLLVFLIIARMLKKQIWKDVK
jgi:ubiquinol-cytochrome c reductase cytochrome c1 subunit